MPFFKTSPSVNPELAEGLVKELVARQQRGVPLGRLDFFQGREEPGLLTGLKCQCGGFLQEMRHAVDVPLPPKPTHRKRRILKKHLKRWKSVVAALTRVSAFMSSGRHPSYRCSDCGKFWGFYQAMGRNLIVVEPFPADVARAFYLEEPET